LRRSKWEKQGSFDFGLSEYIRAKMQHCGLYSHILKIISNDIAILSTPIISSVRNLFAAFRQIANYFFPTFLKFTTPRRW